MRTVNLSSGSKGNSTYVESLEAKILIDDGLSYQNIKSRLTQIGVEPSDIDAILLTHEHVDHIGGIVLSQELHVGAVGVVHLVGDDDEAGV